MATAMARSAPPRPEVRVGADFERTWRGASALATECVLNLAALSDRILAYGEAIVRRSGLPSLAAFNVLTILDGAGEPLPPSVIAERMIVSRPTMTRTLRSLERRTLVRRVPHPTDRRMSLVGLTRSGRGAVARLRPELHRLEKRWMAALSRQEQRALLNALARIQAGAPALDGPTDI